jgi:cell division protein ZapA
MGKNKVEVSIGGNTYSLQGDESKEHILEVASTIDQKIAQIREKAFSNSLSSAHINILAAIQLASDYVKLKEEMDQYIKEVEKWNHEQASLMLKKEQVELENIRLKTEIAQLKSRQKRG